MRSAGCPSLLRSRLAASGVHCPVATRRPPTWLNCSSCCSHLLELVLGLSNQRVSRVPSALLAARLRSRTSDAQQPHGACRVSSLEVWQTPLLLRSQAARGTCTPSSPAPGRRVGDRRPTSPTRAPGSSSTASRVRRFSVSGAGSGSVKAVVKVNYAGYSWGFRARDSVYLQ